MSGPNDSRFLSSPASPRSNATAQTSSEALIWWRTRLPSSFTVDDRYELVAALGRVEAPELGQWPEAAKGDPAACIAVAFTVLPVAAYQQETLDSAMSAVLRCALVGDAASIAMLVHVLGRLGRRRTDLRRVLLAGAWRRAAAALRDEPSSPTMTTGS